jgi:uncharacterized protein (TIGR02246 family)
MFRLMAAGPLRLAGATLVQPGRHLWRVQHGAEVGSMTFPGQTNVTGPPDARRNGSWILGLPVTEACHRLLDGLEVHPMPFHLVFVLALLSVTSHASAQRPTSPLMELTKQYLEAAKARDAAKVASFYAEDAVVMPPNAPPIKGRKAIQLDHERLFKESPSFELTATPLASETSGALGYIQGEFVVKRQGGGEVRGKYVEVWKRINGEWKILYDINNANHPPAAPTPATPRHDRHRRSSRRAGQCDGLVAPRS